MIPTIFDAIVRSDRNGRGAAGETFASDLLKAAGYDVEKRVEKKCGDLRAADTTTGEFWNIEVKTAKQRPDGKFCFQLVNKTQDYRHSDYVLLLAILRGGKVASFLIKTKTLQKQGVRKSLTISNVNSGMWSDFRVKRTVKLS